MKDYILNVALLSTAHLSEGELDADELNDWLNSLEDLFNNSGATHTRKILDQPRIAINWALVGFLSPAHLMSIRYRPSCNLTSLAIWLLKNA